MKAPIRIVVNDYVVIVQKSENELSIDFSRVLPPKNLGLIILPSMDICDLAWFKELLSCVSTFAGWHISFQGTSICREVYQLVKMYQKGSDNLQLSFSIEIASNFVLSDQDVLSRVDYLFDPVSCQTFNTEKLTYKEFKRVLPIAKGIANKVEEANPSSDIEKIIYIDNWMQKHIQYIKKEDFIEFGLRFKYPQIKKEAIVTDVLLNHYGVCEDVSASVSAIASMLGIQTEVVSKGGHAWNLICVEHKWYIYDCTHNITRNEKRVANELKATEYNYNYLLRGLMYDKEKYYIKEVFNNQISVCDFPRVRIEECIKKMVLDGCIDYSFENNVKYKNRIRQE